MPWRAGLGSVNLGLVALYLAPIWGRDALRALLSPFEGFEDRGHAAVAGYFRELFNLGLEGLLRVSATLAGLKLVVAAGFLAYLIEFARATAVGREVDRETVDGVLVLAAVGAVIWTLPVLVFGDPALIRVSAAQLMLVSGAVMVITVERQIEQTAGRSDVAPPTDMPQLEPNAA